MPLSVSRNREVGNRSKSSRSWCRVLRTHSGLVAPASPHTRQPSSQYNPSIKSPSIQSKRSFSSAVSGILRRATSKRKNSRYEDGRDAISLYSSTSTSTAFPRLLSKQSSNVSLQTEYSLATGDSYGGRLRTHDYGSGSHSVPASPSVSRSTTRSHRAPPPSSFVGKAVGRESRHPASTPP